MPSTTPVIIAATGDGRIVNKDLHDGRYNNGNYQNSAAYQQGYKDGVWDTQHGPQQRSRNWKNDYDAQAYRQGYNAGYRGTGAYNNNGRYNGRYDNRGSYGYGNSGYSGYGIARTRSRA